MINADVMVVRENLELMVGSGERSMHASLAGEKFFLQQNGTRASLTNFGYDPNTGGMFGFEKVSVINRKIFSVGEFKVRTDGERYRIAGISLPPVTSREARETIKETVLQYNAGFGF